MEFPLLPESDSLYMEAAFKVVGNLSDIRHIEILVVLIVITGELEVHLLAEKVFQEEVHQLAILFLLKVVIVEHGNRPANYQLSVGFGVVVNSTDRSIARIGQRPRGQNGICRILDCQTDTVNVDKIDTCSFRFLLILLLFLVVTTQHEGVVLTLRFFSIAVDDSCDLFAENAIVDVGFLGVEVFVKGGPDHTVRVYGDSELFSDF